MVVPSLIAKRSCRLIVRNLHFKATPESLLELFGPYGPIREISIPLKDGEEAKLAVSDFPQSCHCSSSHSLVHAPHVLVHCSHHTRVVMEAFV